MKSAFRAIGGFFDNIFFAVRLIRSTSKLYFFLAIVMSALSGLYGVVQAIFLKKIIDGLGNHVPFGALVLSAAIILFGLLLNKVVSRLLMALNRIITDKLGYSMEYRVLEAMERVPTSKMDDPAFLNRVEQAQNLVKTQPNNIFMNIFGIVIELSGLIGYYVILSGFHWASPLVLLATAVLLFAVNNRYEENVMSFLFSASPERRRMGYVASLLTGRDSFEEIRSYRAGNFFRAQYKENMHKQLTRGWSIFRKNAFLYIAAAIISYLGCGAIYLWVLKCTFDGAIGIGDMTMLLSACVGIQTLCTELVDGLSVLPSSLMTLGSYRSFIRDAAAWKDPPALSAREDKESENTIAFEDVSFSYAGSDHKVLDHTSFVISKSRTTALVGVNGAGKSTIVKLILGLYDDYEGRILISDRDARSMTRAERAEALTAMFQNYLKPNVSVAESVALGEEIQNDRVASALRIGGLEDVLPTTNLSKTFDPKGWVPSGGQWQKLALARMLYRDTKCYILDEPSAALDAEAELSLFKTIAAMRGQKTILFITHRLASIIDADEVIFLAPGGAVTQGTHKEMLEKCSGYSALYHAQADRYEKV